MCSFFDLLVDGRTKQKQPRRIMKKQADNSITMHQANEPAADPFNNLPLAPPTAGSAFQPRLGIDVNTVWTWGLVGVLCEIKCWKSSCFAA
jgi:hypothetical protein